MNVRPLGKSGLSIAPIVFGGNVFGWTADAATSFALLDAFVDAGFNAVDTADAYSRWVKGHQGGESETVLGQWFAQGGGRRDKVVLMTKVGDDMGNGRSLKRDYILRAVEDLLQRLKTDRIDLYQTHWDDDATPPDETLSAYDRLMRDGKVRAIGASNLSPARLEASFAASKASGLPAYTVLQPLYNLSDRKPFESDYGPICRREGLGVITYFSLAAGFLTGKYRSAEDVAKNPARSHRVKPYVNERGLRIVDALTEIASRHNAVPAQVALAWLLARPVVTAPIVSATNLGQLRELLASVDLKLSNDDIARLDTASA